MSDAELEAIAKGQKLQHLSDEELEAIAGRKEFPQAQEPQNPAENPANFIEQQHPAISTPLRSAIYAGGGNTGAALQKQLGPDFDIKEQKGRYYVKGKGEKDYLAFDPDMSPLEMLKDYHTGHVPEVQKDLIYDNLDMGLQALLGGTGILPGLLGGGVINLVQQGIGNLTGGRRGLNVGEAAVNAGLGATTNAIPMATKAVATRVLPTAGEFLTGMPAQATKAYIEQGSEKVLGGTAREQMQALQAQLHVALTDARVQAMANVRAARQGLPGSTSLPEAEAALADVLAKQKALKPFISNPNPSLGSVGNAQKKANEAQLDFFKEVDQAAPGAGLQEGSARAFARQEFSNASLLPKGLMRNLSAAGGRSFAGAMLGLDPALASIAGLMSAPLQSPYALKLSIDAAKKAAPAVKSAWLPLGSELYEKANEK